MPSLTRSIVLLKKLLHRLEVCFTPIVILRIATNYRSIKKPKREGGCANSLCEGEMSGRY